jgi:hypothetical protein
VGLASLKNSTRLTSMNLWWKSWFIVSTMTTNMSNYKDDKLT